jgi:predicted membrane protein (TIGR00267 family)
MNERPVPGDQPDTEDLARYRANLQGEIDGSAIYRGAIVPISPFPVASGLPAVIASVAASAVALMGVGIAITVVTGASAVRSGARQVVFGLVAAAITFGLGSLVGAAPHQG